MINNLKNCSSYYFMGFSSNEKFRTTIDRSVQYIRPLIEKRGVNCLVVSGQSGLLYGSAVAYNLGIDLISIRKRSEKSASHAECVVEGLWLKQTGVVNPCNYLIYDDFVDSGSTIERILKEIKDITTNGFGYEKHNFVGIFLHQRIEKPTRKQRRRYKMRHPGFVSARSYRERGRDSIDVGVGEIYNPADYKVVEVNNE